MLTMVQLWYDAQGPAAIDRVDEESKVSLQKLYYSAVSNASVILPSEGAPPKIKEQNQSKATASYHPWYEAIEQRTLQQIHQ